MEITLAVLNATSLDIKESLMIVAMKGRSCEMVWRIVECLGSNGQVLGLQGKMT